MINYSEWEQDYRLDRESDKDSRGYTKGEWWIDKGDFGYTVKAEQSIVKGFDDDNDIEIAELNTYLDNESEVIANAQLIASAPDLYEACKEASEWLVLMEAYIPLHSLILDGLNKALAKAEGK